MMHKKPLTLRQRCDFAKHQRPLHNSETLKNDLTNLFQIIHKHVIDDKALLSEFERSYQYGILLIDIAPRFDYSPNIRANGFWTFIQMIIKFYRLTLYSFKKNAFNSDVTRKALQVLNISLRCCEDIATINNNKINNNCTNENENENTKINNDDNENQYNNNNQISFKALSFNESEYCLFVSALDNNVELDYLTKKALEAEDEFIEFYANYNGYWLQPCAMQIVVKISDYMGLFYKQSTDFRLSRNIFSRRIKAKMFHDMTMNVSMDELKKFWNMAENSVIEKVFNRFARDNKNVLIKDFAIQSQNRWKISTNEHSTIYDMSKSHEDDGDIEKRQFAKSSPNGIPCLLFQSKDRKTNKQNYGTVLIHVHGGGFISQSPKSHRFYLQDWIDKYKDLTIISIDYRLAPEHQFPAALQDILDVYIWLLKPAGLQFLGFTPTKIAFAGDSAGGNLVLSMSLVLNSLKEKIPKNDPFLNEFYMPKAIFSFYGVFMIAPNNSPSRIISLNDGLLNMGPLMACLNAYLPIDLDNTETVYRFTENPYLSPLLANNFDFTTDISLYLFETTFDPFLDDNVELAKRWKGNVKFEVLPDLPHGFLNFIKISPKCQQANDLCLEHFSQFCNHNNDII